MNLVWMEEEVFDGILNFRDVGATVNYILGAQVLQKKHLYRSARLGGHDSGIGIREQQLTIGGDGASERDRLRIREQFGIASVIDLRTKSEHIKQSQRRDLETPSPTFPNSDHAIAASLQIPGIYYFLVNFNGSAFQRALLWQLSWWSLIKLIILMICGYRMEAISIMGREVLQQRGLIGLGYDSLDLCGEEIYKVFSILAAPANYPVIVHCTQGKDRTGLVVALVLFLLDIPLEVISYDYVLSEEKLLPEKESRLEEIREIGLTEDFAGAPRDWIHKMHDHIVTTYGGVDDYLDHIGVREAMRTSVKNSLVV